MPLSEPHDICDRLLQQAETIARQANTKLTPIRRHVYACLLQAEQPLGAYEILDMLEGIGAQKPPTVYRALDWLLELGLIRRVASVSKFVALPHGQSFDPVAVLRCRDCGKIDIMETGLATVLRAAESQGFDDLEATLEIVGRCDAPHSA